MLTFLTVNQTFNYIAVVRLRRKDTKMKPNELLLNSHLMTLLMLILHTQTVNVNINMNVSKQTDYSVQSQFSNINLIKRTGGSYSGEVDKTALFFLTVASFTPASFLLFLPLLQFE